MTEEEQDRRRQIIQGAMQVFSEKGYHKASIKAIGQEAGLRSPALIYHYFENKRDLLEAVLDEFTPFKETPLSNPALAARMLELPPEQVLTQVALQILRLRDNPDLVRLMRLYLSEAARDQEIASAVGGFQQRALTFLRGYLDRQVELGRLRPHDTNSSARMLIGSLIIYLLGKEIFPLMGEGFAPAEEYARSVVDLFLQGVQNHPAPLQE